jgi:hypothetical protein
MGLWTNADTSTAWVNKSGLLFFRLLWELLYMLASKNFTGDELQCPCCNEICINQTFLEQLQNIRTEMDRPFCINSAYRCNNHNKDVGGSPKSNHLTGKAVDISTEGWSGQDIHYFLYLSTHLESVAHFSTGIGIYPTWIHFDMRDEDNAWVKT